MHLPPKSTKSDSELLKELWESFAQTLRELQLPQVIDRSNTPQTVDPESVTVAMLSEPSSRLIIGLEGGKQLPGGILLVLATSWLEKRGKQLYLHKGLWFNQNQQGFFDSFDPPRKVTYFANFYTLGASDGVRDDGIPFETELDCPCSSSSALEVYVNDKVFTRCLLGNAGVSCPRTLAFPFRSPKEYPVGQMKIDLVKVEERMDKSFFEMHLKQFLAKYSDIVSVVVKPSGPLWFGSRGVSIFREFKSITPIVEAMSVLMQNLHEGDSILVDEFLPTLQSQVVLPGIESTVFPTTTPFSTMDKHRAAHHQLRLQGVLTEEEASVSFQDEPRKVTLGFRLRVVATRNQFNKPVVSKMVVGIGDMNTPINGDNTMPQTLDSALSQWGINEESVKRNLEETIIIESERAFQAIIDYEQTLTDEQRGHPGAQTDIIGLDVILAHSKSGIIVPFVIEINDHDCTLQSQMLEFLLPGTLGECVRPWVSNMISRSQRYLLEEKVVLVIGGGGLSKQRVWNVAESYKLKIVLIDEHTDHMAKSRVHKFITYPDMPYHKNDPIHAEWIVNRLAQEKIVVHGVVTFWEECNPLAALVASKLGLTGNPYESHFIAKSKRLTQQTLLKKVGSWPHKVSTHYFAVPSFTLHTVEDIEEGLKQVPLPAVLKLEHGCSAVGVRLVTTKKQVVEVFESLQKMASNVSDRHGNGLGFESSVILAEYIDGSEHDIDVVMWKGKMLAAFVTDNGPTRLPYFAETSAWMPSLLHPDKEAALKTAAVQCLLELDLHTGVFNVEMKLTATGPRLIEINARPGGFYVMDWIQLVWGVDLTACAYMIACGIKPILQYSSKPNVHIAGILCYASQHAKAFSTIATFERLTQLHENGTMRFIPFETDIPEPTEYEEPMGSIGCTGTSHVEIKQKLISSLQILGLDSADVPVSWYFQNLPDSKKTWFG